MCLIYVVIYLLIWCDIGVLFAGEWDWSLRPTGTDCLVYVC